MRRKQRREIYVLKGRLMCLGWHGLSEWAAAHNFKRETVRKTVHRYLGKKNTTPYGETTTKILRKLKETVQQRQRPRKETICKKER